MGVGTVPHNYASAAVSPAGEVDAVLCGRNAEQLLGIKPCDLNSSPEQLQQLEELVARITQIDPRGEGAAWLDLALTSLYPDGVQGRAEAEAACHYAFHDAQLLSDEEMVQELAARQARYQWNVENG